MKKFKGQQAILAHRAEVAECEQAFRDGIEPPEKPKLSIREKLARGAGGGVVLFGGGYALELFAGEASAQDGLCVEGFVYVPRTDLNGDGDKLDAGEYSCLQVPDEEPTTTKKTTTTKKPTTSVPATNPPGGGGGGGGGSTSTVPTGTTPANTTIPTTTTTAPLPTAVPWGERDADFDREPNGSDPSPYDPCIPDNQVDNCDGDEDGFYGEDDANPDIPFADTDGDNLDDTGLPGHPNTDPDTNDGPLGDVDGDKKLNGVDLENKRPGPGETVNENGVIVTTTVPSTVAPTTETTQPEGLVPPIDDGEQSGSDEGSANVIYFAVGGTALVAILGFGAWKVLPPVIKRRRGPKTPGAYPPASRPGGVQPGGLHRNRTNRLD